MGAADDHNDADLADSAAALVGRSSVAGLVAPRRAPRPAGVRKRYPGGAAVASLYHLPHISTGEAFRAAVREGSQLGRTAQGYMEQGELVPDEVVVGVLREHL